MSQNPLMKFIQMIPVAKLPKAMKLMTELGPTKANDLTMDKIHSVFSLFDVQVSGDKLGSLLRHAAAAPAEMTAQQFIEDLGNDGLLEQLLTPEPSAFLVRCPFCEHPFEVDPESLV